MNNISNEFNWIYPYTWKTQNWKLLILKVTRIDFLIDNLVRVNFNLN